MYKFMLLVVLLLLNSCDVDTDVNRVVREKYILTDLVMNSTVIAVVDIVDAGASFDKLPRKVFESVDAKIILSVCNNYTDSDIKIENFKNKEPNRYRKIFFRNGKHLVFLRKEGTNYFPVASGTVIRVFRDKLNPIWEVDWEGAAWEYPLGRAIKDISQFCGNL